MAGSTSPLRLGLDVLFAEKSALVRGRRVGLITNPTGVDRELIPTIERLRSAPGIKLAALYGPEHGVRGNAQAGEYVPFYYDEHLQLPVFSLYGQSQKPPPGFLTQIDATMRSYDTQPVGKTAERSMVDAVDVLVFDVQDVGTRVYTYVATMAYAMQAAAEARIPFVVLDRPNPINGVTMEGPVLEYPALSSFVGLYPVPLRHGMTAGELARFFNAKFLAPKVELTVVPMTGWRRSDWFDDTRLPWVVPSPNLPTVEAATVYPGQVLLEGTNISEGRGTTKPFEFFGAPWLDGYVLARELNARGWPGVRFREAWFTPTFSKFHGERCGGCQLHVVDREAFRPVTTTLGVLEVVRAMSGGQFEFHPDYFDHVIGTVSVRRALDAGEPAAPIVAGFERGLAEFSAQREEFLLYPVSG
ncbi:MAG: DUF1343 domain-containing protein [Opitutaceae bacterium]|nr:DUF1343 domain-containing protein [Opitutaceae bacterium]